MTLNPHAISEHLLDRRRDPVSRPRERLRRIQNWQFFKRLASNDDSQVLGFEDSDPTPIDATGTPDHWDGNFDHVISAERGPLQAYFGNDPNNRAHVRVRRADRPRAWAEFIWLDPDNIVAPERLPERRIRWQGYWNQCSLIYVKGLHKVDKVIRCNTKARNTFDFALRLPPGFTHSLNLNTGVLTIRDAQGRIVIVTRPPMAWDSSPPVEIDGEPNSIRVSIAETGTTPQGWARFRLTVHPDDVASLVLPFFVDPTATLLDAGLEDNWLYGLNTVQSSRERNHGAQAQMSHYSGVSSPRHTIQRLADPTNDIPDGTITAHRWNWNSVTTHSNATLQFARLVDANADWVEGTASGSPQAGSSCWEWKAYTSPGVGTVWANGTARITSADWDGTSESIGPFSLASGVYMSFDLPTVWLDEWKSGARANGGFITRIVAGSERFYGVADTTHPASLDIDYDEAAGNPHYTMFSARR